MTTNHHRESIIDLSEDEVGRVPEAQTIILKKLILAELKEQLKDTQLEVFNLHIIIKYVMESVENTPFKGIEQKELALKLIRELVNAQTDNDDKKLAMLVLLDNGTIGNMIDLIVDATKGKLDVNKLKRFGFNCFTICFPLLCMKKTKKKPIKKSDDVITP